MEEIQPRADLLELLIQEVVVEVVSSKVMLLTPLVTVALV
jgi:hypothetical protein